MPTNTPIPTVSTGNVIAAATQNDMAVLNTCIGLLGLTSPGLHGSPPATGAPNYQVQAGTLGVTFASGTGTLTFPTAFPNGLLTVLTTIQAGASTTSSHCAPVYGGSFTTSSVALWGALSGAAATGSYYVHYIAIGW